MPEIITNKKKQTDKYRGRFLNFVNTGIARKDIGILISVIIVIIVSGVTKVLLP